MADDDDAPPPLSSLADQVEALKLRSQPAAAKGSAVADVPVASTVVVPEKRTSKPATIKKGFFDAPVKPKPKAIPQPAAAAKPSAPSASASAKDGDVEEITVLRPSRPHGPGSGPRIPDFMRLEPDEQALKYQAMKQQLVDKLKPTPDMVDSISKDPMLLAGFDDPDVMAAVSDVASNPQNFKKYQNNPKVVAFYQAMGKVMGEKLEKEGGITPPTAAKR